MPVGAEAEAGPESPPRPGPDLRLPPAATVTWVLTWWATAQAAVAVLIVAAVLILATGLLGLVLARGRMRAGGPAAASALVLLVATTGLTVTGLRLLDREQDPLTRAAATRLTATVTGRVSGDPRRLAEPSASGADRYVVRIAADRVRVRGGDLLSSGRLVVIGGPSWGGLVAGSHVRVVGRLEPADAGDAASAMAFPRGSPTVVDPGSWIWRAAERLRTGLRVACRGLPADASGLLPALVVGDTSRLDPQLQADLKASGLSHLTSVSGANVA